VKSGWSIQLVEGFMPVAEIGQEDPPSQRVFKTMGFFFLKGRGLNSSMGLRLGEMLEQAGMTDIGKTEGLSRLGRGHRRG
jgi:hypothetical protein